jgi:ribosomal protein S18 acetylase RimI-like enzyme
MCSAVTTRPIAESDREFLRELYASTRREELAPVPWSEEQKREFLASQFALQHEHYQRNYVGAEFLVIERHGAPIGRLYVYRTPGEIRVMDIALVDAERGRGLGTRLLQGLMAQARETGAQVTLHVEPNNPACRLYERLGFRLIESRGVYLFRGWKAL